MVGRNFVMEKKKDSFLPLKKETWREEERKEREKEGSRVFVRARFRRLTFRLRVGRDGAVSSGDDRNPSRNNSISERTTTDYTTTTPHLPGSADR